ncbi:MAG: hypothetical protein ACTHMC_00810 [Pseudobacter sp.]|uniref:hypothetical protein n=1 Tax=Pseudobacter sp. TaxID=2045420 RepID=UPI003F8232F5
MNNLIENTPKGDLAIFVCGYNSKQFETTVQKLTDQDLSELLDYGVDIFFNINRCYSENNLILKKHKDFQQYLILICPEIEKWLLKDAMVINLDPADEKFGLPPGLKGFRSISKTQDMDRNDGFKRFIKALINNNAPSVSTLQSWLDLYKSGTINNLCSACSQKPT